jgi:hypothetical protein
MPQYYMDPETDDLYVSPTGSSRLTSSLREETAQRLSQNLRWFLGEWVLNRLKGVPFFRDVFVKDPNLTTVQGVFARVIQDDPGVGNLDQITVTLDAGTRQATVTFSATLVDGSVLNSAETA